MNLGTHNASWSSKGRGGAAPFYSPGLCANGLPPCLATSSLGYVVLLMAHPHLVKLWSSKTLNVVKALLEWGCGAEAPGCWLSLCKCSGLRSITFQWPLCCTSENMCSFMGICIVTNGHFLGKCVPKHLQQCALLCFLAFTRSDLSSGFKFCLPLEEPLSLCHAGTQAVCCDPFPSGDHSEAPHTSSLSSHIWICMI